MGNANAGVDFLGEMIANGPNPPTVVTETTASNASCAPCADIQRQIAEIERVKNALRRSCAAEPPMQHQGPGSGVVPPPVVIVPGVDPKPTV